MYYRVVFNPATNHYIIIRSLTLNEVTNWESLKNHPNDKQSFHLKKGTFSSLLQARVVQKKMNRAIDTVEKGKREYQ